MAVVRAFHMGGRGRPPNRGSIQSKENAFFLKKNILSIGNIFFLKAKAIFSKGKAFFLKERAFFLKETAIFAKGKDNFC